MVDDQEEVVSAEVRDYYFGGSGREVTLAANRQGWDAIELWPRALAAVGVPDLGASLASLDLPTPLIVAPMAYLSLLRPKAEAVVAEEAAKRGISFCLSTRSGMPLEEVAEAWRAGAGSVNDGGRAARLLLQIYAMRDVRLTNSLVDRAVAAGFDAIMITVDTPYIGLRYRDRENGFAVPAELLNANLQTELAMAVQGVGQPSFGTGVSSAANAALAQDPAFGWAEFTELVARAGPLPSIAKGVLHPADIAAALSAGACAVVISNHGGRQLDGSPSTASALYRAGRDVAWPRRVMMVDGAIASGADVLRAVALGAGTVMVGRSLARALADGGRSGVATAMDLLLDDLLSSAAIFGISNLAAISRESVSLPPAWG